MSKKPHEPPEQTGEGGIPLERVFADFANQSGIIHDCVVNFSKQEARLQMVNKRAAELRGKETR